ncbi:MAG TPA: M23 family metallopeptidase [Candidatus Nitrosotalea sp.]|nr:M23 family metallopeptidase [Candidatus Nitrosotalea sp.]
MSQPGRGFTVVLVYGGGTRMLHVGCPRGFLVSGLLGLLLGLSLLTGTWWDYFALKRAQVQAASFEQRVEEQRALLEAFEQRVAEINREVGSWQAVHFRMWSTFGPSPGVAGKGAGTGMGGAVAVLPMVFASEAPALPQALALLSSNVSESGQSLRAFERFMERTRPMLMSLPVRWPVRGPLNSRFGMRPSPWTGDQEFHRGLDISAHRGTPVAAPASGTVFFAGDGGEYGTTVILDHGHDLRSLYGHLQEIRVKHGQHVERGQVIALTGNTGRTSGPHLHYEIQVRGQAVDPRQFLWD